MARADGLSASAEGTYASTRTTSTDQAGETTHTTSTPWTGVLRLALDRTLLPRLAFNGSGNYQLTRGSATTDTESSESEQRLWSLNGGLTFGDPVLNGIASYSRRSESGESRTAEDVRRSPVLVSETYTLSATWSPLDLPRLSLVATRGNNFDAERAFSDNTSTDVALSTGYQPIERMDLHYVLRFSQSEDHVHGVDSSSVQNSASASWGDSFFDRRAALSLAYSVGSTATSVTVAGAGGTVATQVFPVAGLSAVETPPTLPTNVALSPNPKLNDGDTVTGAGINIGFSPRLSADDRLRDVGVRLADTVTQVNTFYVWVDKPLPFQVSGAYTWNAYRSTDNLIWTEVPITAPVVFGEFQNRFEITIAPTAAEYLKIVTRPLLPGASPDQRFADVLVTEVQVLQVLPASAAPASQLRVAGSFSASGRVRLLSTVNYDSSFAFTHGNASSKIPWSLQNGLSWGDRLGPVFSAAARVERSDSDTLSGHSAEWRWNASLAADPLPTLNGGASYSGRASTSPEGSTVANSFGVFGRQNVYEGVGLSENAAYGVTDFSGGRRIASYGVSATASANPHPKAAMSASWSYTAGTTSGPGQPEVSSSAMRVDAGVSVNPVPALYGSAGLSYFTGGARPTTTYNVSASASPFPGGELVFRFSYLESYETATDVRTRQVAPTARWNIGRFAFLDLVYSFLAYRSPVLVLDTRTISASLVVRIR